MPTHDDMARFSYARDESTLTRPRLCISRGDSINCSGFGPEANGWLLRLPPVLQTLHGFSMPPIALTPMLDKLADTSVGTINLTSMRHRYRRMGRAQRYPSILITSKVACDHQTLNVTGALVDLAHPHIAIDAFHREILQITVTAQRPERCRADL